MFIHLPLHCSVCLLLFLKYFSNYAVDQYINCKLYPLLQKACLKTLNHILVINKYLLLLASLLSLTAFCISPHLHTCQSVIGMIVGAN